jgi:hypothetical protein
MKRIVTLLTTLILASAALAAPKQYQVELLIYSHLTPAAISSEHWPAAVDHTNLSTNQTITLEPATLSPLDDYPTLTYLPPEAWKLTRDAKRIENKLQAVVLYHQAWRVDRSELAAKPMHFVINDQTSFDSSAASKLAGTLSIKLTRYFNTDLQLTMSEPKSAIRPYLSGQANPCWHGDNCYFSFDVKRRTRSKALNYLDHPLYGALLEITAVKDAPTPAIRGG